MTTLGSTIRSQRPTQPASTMRRRPQSLGGQLVLFLVLAYGLSWWPWPLSDLETQPDAALMVPMGPSIAALVLVLWLRGRPAARRILRSLVHVRLGRWWLVLLLPVVIATATAAAAVVAGAPAPTWAGLASAVAGAIVSFPILLVVGGPLGEELGWRGFVLPTLLRQHGPIAASLLLASMWIPFHLPWIMNRPEQYGPVWALAIVGMTLTMTWIYLHTSGSLALAVAFHTVINTATPAAIRLFPEADRALTWGIAAALWLLAGLAAAVLMAARRTGAPESVTRVAMPSSPPPARA